MHQNPHQNKHLPVLLGEVLNYLDPKKGESFLDLTAGYGGHASKIIKRTGNPSNAVLVERDPVAHEHLHSKFSGSGVVLLNQDFLSASTKLAEGERTFDLILADLGVSSPHLNEVSRGFSFHDTGPLDMRMDTRQSTTAAELLNGLSERELADLLLHYGEEPKAKQIAHGIVQNRPLHSTAQLAEIAKRAWSGHSRTHPATRTFQAIRIAVNDELNQLEQSLPIWLKLLSPGGRIAVISFHSLEDRLVKQFFASESGDRYDTVLTLLTKHPVTPKPHEVALNPRARSAKLRAAVKQK